MASTESINYSKNAIDHFFVGFLVVSIGKISLPKPLVSTTFLV
jgi:hypothetical protein